VVAKNEWEKDGKMFVFKEASSDITPTCLSVGAASALHGRHNFVRRAWPMQSSWLLRFFCNCSLSPQKSEHWWQSSETNIVRT